jgi:hypothetical protein
MRTPRSSTSIARGTWTAPLLLAIISLLGLLSALLGEEQTWKIVAWMALSVPVLTTIWFCFRRQ